MEESLLFGRTSQKLKRKLPRHLKGKMTVTPSLLLAHAEIYGTVHALNLDVMVKMSLQLTTDVQREVEERISKTKKMSLPHDGNASLIKTPRTEEALIRAKKNQRRKIKSHLR